MGTPFYIFPDIIFFAETADGKTAIAYWQPSGKPLQSATFGSTVTEHISCADIIKNLETARIKVKKAGNVWITEGGFPHIRHGMMIKDWMLRVEDAELIKLEPFFKQSTSRKKPKGVAQRMNPTDQPPATVTSLEDASLRRSEKAAEALAADLGGGLLDGMAAPADPVSQARNEPSYPHRHRRTWGLAQDDGPFGM